VVVDTPHSVARVVDGSLRVDVDVMARVVDVMARVVDAPRCGHRRPARREELAREQGSIRFQR